MGTVMSVLSDSFSKTIQAIGMIYTNMPHSPNILRIDGYPDEETSVENLISSVCKATGMPQPHEQILVPFQWDEEDEVITKLQFDQPTRPSTRPFSFPDAGLQKTGSNP